MKHMLTSPHIPASLTATNRPMESPLVVLSVHSTTNSQLLQPVNSFASVKTNEEENKKAAAAAVATKLAASTSSAQMLTSFLSSLVAEEAASMSGGALKSSGFTSSLPMFPAEKQPRLENPLPSTDVKNNPDRGSSAGYFTSQQSIQTNQMQDRFPPPLPPSAPHANSPGNQFVQPGVMMGVMPYAYGATSCIYRHISFRYLKTLSSFLDHAKNLHSPRGWCLEGRKCLEWRRIHS